MLDRAALEAMPRHTVELPIACVEGWSTTQTWTGIRLADLAAAAGRPHPGSAIVSSLERFGAFNHAVLQTNQILEPRLAVGVAGQRCRPLVGSRLSGADHRSRASRSAQHQMGVHHRIPGNLMRALAQRAARLYGERLFHLLVVLAALALGAYAVSVLGVQNLFNPTVWWQSIVVWFVVAVIGHDLHPVSALRAGRPAAAQATHRPQRR